MCRCVVFYVCKGRRYENNDIFLKLRACRPTLLLRRAAYISWWLAGCMLGRYSDVAGVSHLISPYVSACLIM